LQAYSAVLKRVLVVDDDDSIRALIQRLLTKSGFDVITASDGEDALRKIDTDRFDAIVLDLMMPRVDGFTVLRHLVSTNPDLVARTVVATAFPSDAMRLQLGEVCRIIIKPFDTAELIEAVRACTEHA
jgi:two-component system, OmpR family, response regulator MprA